MIQSIRFWLTWSRADRWILLVAALLFIFTMGWMWAAYFQSPAPVIEFQTIQESKLSEIPVDRFQKGVFEFAIAGNNYTITERLLGTTLRPNPTAGYIYLITFTVAIIGLLTVVSTLNRFYYLVGMGLFILLVVNLKFEVLEMFGRTDKSFTIGILSVYILSSFYIFYFAPSFTFIARGSIFTGITIFVGFFVLFFSETPLPFLHLATFSVPAGIVGAGLFILLVAHEIIAAFIFVVTQGTKQTKSLNHFLIITTVYLVNLALAYSVKFGFIQWNLITINLFLLLSISAVLGIWGIRQRQKQFGSILDVEPYGVYGFLLLGSVCFGATAFFLASANDPVVDAISDGIIFAHIGYGIIFLTYILSNFIGMLGQNLRVHRVLYNPTNMPYFTFRFAGLIATLAFVFYNTWQVPVHNAFAGFYNANGDLYLSLNNSTVAQLLFDQGRTYGFSNHHSNYALANLEGARFNTNKERAFYRSAVYKRPTEMAYLNLAQTYQTERNLLEAILVLNEGLQKFPDSGPLRNTLGLLYEQANVRDSAVFHLRAAALGLFKKESPEINLLSLAAKDRIKLPFDSAISENETIGVKANKLGWANANKRVQALNFVLPKDTVIDLSQAVYINNYLINHLGDVDSAMVNSVILLARKPVNSGFREALMFSSALSLYATSEVQKAFRLLEEVTIGSSNQGKYNNILTLWALEQNEPERALGYINYALGQQYPPASISHAVALTEAARVDGPFGRGKPGEAIKVWDSLMMGTDTIAVSLARRMTNVLSMHTSVVSQLSDEDKYAYCRYRLNVADSLRLLQIVSEIKSEDYQARTLLEFSQRLFDVDELRASIMAFQRIKGMQLTDKSIYDNIRLHELLLLAKMGDSTGLTRLLKGDFDFSGKRRVYKTYFEALSVQAAGDTLKATQMYRWLGQANPFFDDGVIAAAEYFRKHGPDRFQPYQILVDAVQNHPSSIKILKSYCVEAARQGFSDFAASSLLQLQQMISPSAYRNFRDQNRGIFEMVDQ